MNKMFAIGLVKVVCAVVLFVLFVKLMNYLVFFGAVAILILGVLFLYKSRDSQKGGSDPLADLDALIDKHRNGDTKT